MEYVQSHGDVSHEEKGRALVEVLSVQVPKDAAPGRVGGGKLHHKHFRHGVAGLAFNSNGELQKIINRVYPLT